MKISKTLLTVAVAAVSLSAVKADDFLLVPNGHGQYNVIARAPEAPTIALFVSGQRHETSPASGASTFVTTSKDSGHGQTIVLRRAE